MPATSRTAGARLGTPRTLTATLLLGLVTGLGLTAPSAPASAAPAPVREAESSQSPPTSDAPDRTVAERRAVKKARQARKARQTRVRARKARWSEIRQLGRAKNIAMAQRGDSYGYGAAGPHAFDCSGLVQYAYHRAGFTGMPRSSSAQAGHTRRIAKSAMRPGDLMFFANGGGVYHVGIFAGRGRGGAPLMVHSSRPGTPVQVAQPWTSSWFAGTVR